MLSLLVAAGVVTLTDRDISARPDPSQVYDPVRAREDLPSGFVQMLPRDFIMPVYDPTFVSTADVEWPDDADVIGVFLDDVAKAYPVSFLNGREMVVDEIAGVPILVTWCPVCATAMVHRRELDGEVLTFGVQGALYQHAMTWWDHDTGSLWSQPLGEAIAGPRRGATLELMPSTFTTWGAWRTAHADTLALDAPGAPTSFELSSLLAVVDLGEEVRGYSFADVRERRVINDVVAGIPVAVVANPVDGDAWTVFSRRIGNVEVELGFVDGELRDVDSGASFDPSRGVVRDSGSLGLEGALDQLPALVARPGFGPTRFPVFTTFWPDGTVWNDESLDR